MKQEQHPAVCIKAQSTQDAGRDALPRCKQMGPIDVNGGVHTAGKQHQRKNVPICVPLRPASCVDWASEQCQFAQELGSCSGGSRRVLRSGPPGPLTPRTSNFVPRWDFL